MLNRRRFFNGLMGLSLGSLLPFNVRSNSDFLQTPDKLLPKSLKKGDTIGLIAPGFAFREDILDKTRELLTRLGYIPYNTDRILKRWGYFSNTDAERAADLNHMFANPEVDAILCIRGGYGCTRILDIIDFESIAAHPKALIGFSDVTALLNAIYQKTGLVCFHGPVGSTLDDPYSIKSMDNILMAGQKFPRIENVELGKDKEGDVEYERYVITEGRAQGRICGGNLSLVSAMAGTDYEIDFTNTLVFLEDIEEAPYRIDRMLTQLLEGSTLKHAAGIVLGVFAGCNQSKDPNSFTLKEVVLDRIKPLGIPAVYGMSFGHIAQNFTFPVGIEAKFDTKSMTVELLEHPVS